MATVELQIPALPIHVRTARLLAVAAARRAGLDEESVDDLRLAVGEAAARAVALHESEGSDQPVVLVLDDDADRVTVTVVDTATPLGVPDHEVSGGGHDVDGFDQHGEGIGLAIVRGLVDDIEVRPLASGTSIRMSWPVLDDEPAGSASSG